MKAPKTLVCAVAALGVSATSAMAGPASLTLFHNNDGESKLLGSDSFGEFDYFLGTLNSARSAAAGAGRDVLTISSGDNFLAGLAWQASQNRVGASPAGSIDPITQNYYDALALTAVGYDAITIGNHEFDFGPAVLADLITGYRNAGGAAPFLSANLNFAGEPALSGLVGSDIVSSTIVSGTSGEQYGIIGVTTPKITTISSPGGVTPTGPALSDVAAAINAEVAGALAGVDKIILSGHLQDLSEDFSLIPLLSGVDVVIAGGGDELLTNAPDANTSRPFGPSIDGPYPLTSFDTGGGPVMSINADGDLVPVVTTQGEYRYVGELNVEFDAAGKVTSFNGNPLLVDPSASPQAVGVFNGIDVQNDIMNPLAADVTTLENTVVATSNVNLDGRRDFVRSVETNLGSLIGDAFIWQAEQLITTANPIIAVQNGGGIRNDSVIAPGNLTAGDIIGVLPFPNSVVVISDFAVSDLVAALQRSVSNFPGTSGGFLQVGGFSFVFDETDGNKIVSIELADGTPLYTDEDGVLYGGKLDLVTNNFTAAGGDGFSEFAAYGFTDLSVGYGQALVNYIDGALGGNVDAAMYPEGGLGRIVVIPEPTSIALIGLAGLALIRRRRSA